MRIQLWSYNYDPEPTGIAPLSTALARAMSDRGHDIQVVAAHPHYPAPRWPGGTLPYREVRHGIRVLRLPLWSGRSTTLARLRQEASFTATLAAALPFLGKPDVLLSVSPSFPAVIPAIVNARLRRIPWVLWLQDILPEGAVVTKILREGTLVRWARRLEQVAYRSAEHIVVISDSFAENLRAKGVSDSKLTRIFNPATRPILSSPPHRPDAHPQTVLTMGNVGYSQNLVAVIEAFQSSPALSEVDANLLIVGDGVAAADVRAAIRSNRVQFPGLVETQTLDAELRRASVGLISQQYDAPDFNVPSKLMNFMGQGLPTVACVRRDSEVARIIDESGGGWVTNIAELGALLSDVLRNETTRRERGSLALRYAQQHFEPTHIAERFEQVIHDVLARTA